MSHHLAPVRVWKWLAQHKLIHIRGVKSHFSSHFPYISEGKMIQVKISLYKLMDLDHFTIVEKYQFWKWKNICWLINPDFFDEWLGYFSILFSIYLAFPKWHKQKKSNFGLGSLYLWAIQLIIDWFKPLCVIFMDIARKAWSFVCYLYLKV